jgi:hypothetical protein
MTTKCTFKGCPKTTEQPFTDGWANLGDWGPGIEDGFYCRAHADALEDLLVSGELGGIQGKP